MTYIKNSQSIYISIYIGPPITFTPIRVWNSCPVISLAPIILTLARVLHCFPDTIASAILTLTRTQYGCSRDVQQQPSALVCVQNSGK